MNSSDSIYLKHILECLDRISSYTVDGRDVFLADVKTQDAVLRNLQVMAESTQKISEELKAKHPEIPWKKLSGFRNILVHNYLGLNMSRIWVVVENEVLALRRQIEFISI